MTQTDSSNSKWVCEVGNDFFNGECTQLQAYDE